MTTQKQHVQMAAKLYQCQDTAKKLYKDEYPEKIKWYTDVIKAAMAKEKLDELKAVMWLCSLDTIKENGMAVMLFMAAAVELIEPTKNN